MREIDFAAIEKYKIPSLKLMENAGMGVVSFLLEEFPELKKMKILVVAGKGNNGGDGFVVSRLLKNKGILVSTWLFAAKNECLKEAKSNLDLLVRTKCSLREVLKSSDLKKFEVELSGADLVVDALLGTGFKGVVSELFGKAIDLINNSKAKVVSVDLPSGLDADDGQVTGSCIEADYTVALGLVKLGTVVLPGLNYAGRLAVKDIGIPPELAEEKEIKLNYSSVQDIFSFLPKRKKDAHKGSVGRMLVVGGSAGMTGAPSLASLAALRTGSGLVTVACSKSLNDIFEVKLTEVMTVPVAENPDRSLSLKAKDRILELLEGFDVLVLGPGLGKNIDTGLLVRSLLKESKKPVVLDADGLNFVAFSPEILKTAKAEVVITPHPGELGRLTGLAIEEIQKNRLETALSFSKKYSVVTVLKGACTVTAFPDGRAYINPTGNPGMATAGSGDVLAGIIGSLIGQKTGPGMAAVSGAFIHGAAGDLAFESWGNGLIASDIIAGIPEAMRKIKAAAG